jgi:lichenan operon transcriptional antiterminator
MPRRRCAPDRRRLAARARAPSCALLGPTASTCSRPPRTSTSARRPSRRPRRVRALLGGTGSCSSAAVARAAARHRDGPAAAPVDARARGDRRRRVRPPPCGARSARDRSEAVFGPFKADLVAGLGELGYFVNEFGIGDVMLHIAITADRVAHGRALEVTSRRAAPRRKGGALSTGCVRASRRAPGRGRPPPPRRARPEPRRRARSRRGGIRHRARLEPDVEPAVRDVVHRAAAFLVDIDHEDFVCVSPCTCRTCGCAPRSRRGRAIRSRARSRRPTR